MFPTTLIPSVALSPSIVVPVQVNDDVAVNDLLRFDIDAVSTTAPKGLHVTLEFRLP